MRKIPKTKYPINIEYDYFSDIRDLLDETIDEVDIYIASIEKDKSAKTKSKIELDIVPVLILNTNFNRIRNNWINKVENYNFSAKANQVINFNDKMLRKQTQVYNRLKDLPDTMVKTPKLQRKLLDQSQVFNTESKQRIKATGTALIDKIQSAVNNAVINETALNLDDIKKLTEKSLINIAFNARDTLAKANGQIIKDIHTENNIGKFEWTTMQDNRVRPSHEALEGKIFSYDNLPSEGLPGSEPNCRCTETPVFDDIEADIE